MKSSRYLAQPLLCFLAAAFCVTFLCSPARAQQPSLRLDLSQLQSNSAANNKFLFSGSRTLDSADLQLDSADDIILSQERSGRLFKYYRGLVYLKYFNDWTGIGNYDELENEQLAESLFVYHGVKSLLDYLEFSPVAFFYNDVMKKLRYYKNMSTVTVDREAGGDLTVDNANDDNDGLLRFRIGVNTKRGIEPQLKIADFFQLRHDIIGQETLLEFRVDF